jgi:hypothetical protein
MRPEQRDRVKRLYSGVQLETGGDLLECNEAFTIPKKFGGVFCLMGAV